MHGDSVSGVNARRDMLSVFRGGVLSEGDVEIAIVNPAEADVGKAFPGFMFSQKCGPRIECVTGSPKIDVEILVSCSTSSRAGKNGCDEFPIGRCLFHEYCDGVIYWIGADATGRQPESEEQTGYPYMGWFRVDHNPGL